MINFLVDPAICSLFHSLRLARPQPVTLWTINCHGLCQRECRAVPKPLLAMVARLTSYVPNAMDVRIQSTS